MAEAMRPQTETLTFRVRLLTKHGFNAPSTHAEDVQLRHGARRGDCRGMTVHADLALVWSTRTMHEQDIGSWELNLHIRNLVLGGLCLRLRV